MALSATTATTRSTIVARASRMPAVGPKPGTPRQVRPPTMRAASAARERRDWGVNIGLPSHVGTGLLGHEISRRPVAVVARQQHVAAVFLVRLVVELAEHAQQGAGLHAVITDGVGLVQLDQRVH